MSEPETTRRAVLAGAAGVTAVTVLSACGSDDGTNIPGNSGVTTGPTAAAGPTSAAAATSGNVAGATGLAKKSEIPVGGGKIFDAEKVVITQPTAGNFKAFSSTCTHQGCAVTTVSGGTINCPCHQSKFAVADGSVKGGPATKGLPAKQIKVEGDSISLA